MMTNLLLRYELSQLRASLDETFARRRDRFLLVVIFAFVLLWLRERLGSAGAMTLPAEAAWAALLAGPSGFAWQRLLSLRVAWLQEHSAVARAALDSRVRAGYLAAAHLFAALLIGVAAAVLGFATGRKAVVDALAAASYAVGLGLAWLNRESLLGGKPDESSSRAPSRLESRSPDRRRAVLRAVLRRQTFDSARPEWAAAATLALTAAAGWAGRDQADAAQVALTLLPSLLCLLFVGRTDPILIGFLPYAGYRPWFVAAAVSLLPAGCFVAAAAAVLALNPPHAMTIFGILILLSVALIVIGIARAWLYPGRLGKAVDLQVQVEFAALLLIAFLLPPLAPVALAWRLWMFRRRYLGLLWVQP